MDMQRTAWIWMVGCVVWLFSGLVRAHLRQWLPAEVSFAMAVMFFVAWFFFRKQTR